MEEEKKQVENVELTNNVNNPNESSFEQQGIAGVSQALQLVDLVSSNNVPVVVDWRCTSTLYDAL